MVGQQDVPHDDVEYRHGKYLKTKIQEVKNDKQNEKIARYERQMEYKSDSTLKAIAKNESRPYFERIAASRVYKKRHQDDD